jgi:hypothetical protein
MRVMCDSPLTWSFDYLYEYEALHVIRILSREVFRLHGSLEYIDDDQDRIFHSAFGKGLNILECRKLIPSTWVPLDDGILGTWIILNMMVSSMEHQQIIGIGSNGIPIWWWDSKIHLSDIFIQMMMMINVAMTMIGLIYFWDVSIGEVETYSRW